MCARDELARVQVMNKRALQVKSESIQVRVKRAARYLRWTEAREV